MKTIKKVMLSVMIVLMASVQVLAFEDSLKVSNEKSFDLVLAEVSTLTQIKLTDKSNNILYEQNINKGEAFSKTFNMELLPDGDYFVEIENSAKVKRLTVEFSEGELTAIQETKHEYFKPVITEKNEMVYVSQFSPNKVPLYVAIYNNRNELIYEETLKGKMDLGRMFDFSKTYSGEYRFYLESNGMRYDQLVYVEN